MYAHVKDGQIVALVSHYPDLEWDEVEERWWDLRDIGVRTARGWLEVQMTDRPADTETHTHDLSYELVDGQPTQVWTAREWTTEEIDVHAERDARLDDLEGRVAALEAVVMAAAVPEDPDDPDVPEWDDLIPAGWWYPGTLLRDVDDIVYNNISGTVLTTPPSGFPGGPQRWTHLFIEVTTGTTPDPDPDPERPEGYVGPWDADTAYKVGDVCDRDGRYYRCRVAHGPEYQGTWGPPQESVWDDLGPV